MANNKWTNHTLELTVKNKKAIEDATNVEFVDTSWCNDACDSITNEKLDIQIYLPTTEDDIPDEGDFNKFNVWKYSDGEQLIEEGTIKEVIDLINKKKD